MSMDTALLQATNETYQNASASMADGFATMNSLAGPLVLVLWGLIVVGFVSALRSNEYFQRIIDALGWVATSITYALHGIAAVVLAVVVMAPAYYVATADPGTRTTVGKYVVGGLALYAFLAFLGYVVKHRLFDPIRANVTEALPEVEDDEEGTDHAEVSES